jgi:hypothetical protein
MTRGFALLIGLMVGFGIARPAAAQQVGDPVVTVAMVLANRAVMITTPCNSGSIPAWWVKPYGGMTILASGTPGGPLLGTLPIPWPTPDPEPESGWCPGTIIPGAPPGTYWVLMVYGLTNQTSAPASAWQQVVVGPRTCTAPPQPPVLVAPPVVNGHDVAVNFSGTYQGCAIDYIELEVGTSPGASNIGTFPLPGFNTFFPGVPPGTYFARARGVNVYGKSSRSTEIPLQIPGPCALSGQPPTPVNPAVTVNGSQVTIAWTLSPPSGAIFHQITLYDPTSGTPLDRVILPSSTSVSASVPPGAYRIRVSAGNACGVKDMVPLSHIDFTVP